MRIVADENIPLVEAFFGHLGPIQRLPGRQMQAEQLAQADLLLVRSVTQVNQQLLAGSPVRYVASATIGTDHIDLGWLQQQGIAFDNAPGCNAESVVDYVVSALVNLAAQEGAELTHKRVGIVGVGNVGSRLQRRLESLGIECLLCDPPRAEREVSEDDGGEQGFVSLPTLLERCSVFCLHTPLTREGAHPSYHLFDDQVLAALPQGAWLINAGRGAVIDNQALLDCLPRRKDLKVVLDVWEPEPSINAELAALVEFGTPHIAGYSLEGRTRGTEMIYRSACRFLGIEPSRQLQSLLPTPALSRVQLDATAANEPDLAARLVRLVYDLRRDHHALQQVLAGEPDQRPAGFDLLRRNYPMRREFSSLQIGGLEAGSALAQQLQAFGFNLVDD
ncbi:4-phosphoerythronate dehydrogenase PdxB [Motiliproteus coralliicola]|uniref:Erythronate-4-phosphate dehydrogenase n=1 Tax=Motiliproteus coralliicola TaxID=2283196 RepID=A0A369WPD8_9GAMM|nr:4-phosphoerythronate dehydrogenase PdxB [Motiliproteus coralliicola]